MPRKGHENLTILKKMYLGTTGKGHQVSVVFPTNITLLEFFRAILVHKKLFLSMFYPLRDTTSKKNCPVHDRICPIQDTIYAEVLVQSIVNIKGTLKQPF